MLPSRPVPGFSRDNSLQGLCIKRGPVWPSLGFVSPLILRQKETQLCDDCYIARFKDE